MRIAMFGGSFNPIHNGHIDIARAVREEFVPDKILFVVAADPPHKTLADNVPASVRLKMTELALEGEDGMEASDIEIIRGGKSYTADTVDELKRRYPGAEICIIVGKDMLNTILEWHEPEHIAGNAVFIGADRPNVGADLEAAAATLREKLNADVRLTTVGGPNISSTAIRDAVRDAKPIYGLTPKSVWEYVYANGLYAPDDIDRILPRLKADLSDMRYMHTIGAMAEAIALADRFGADANQARLAALLHDCAKLSRGKQLELAAQYGVDANMLPALLHGPLSAVRAQREYGVMDAQILDAIRFHTAGRVGMTLLDKIVFVADKIERVTRRADIMREAREAAEADIDRATLLCMDESIKYVLSKGEELDSCTIAARNDIIKQIKD